MKKNAFTFTEVMLIILVIGVIAVLTIPNVITDNVSRSNISFAKKAWQNLDDVYDYAINTEGYSVAATSSDAKTFTNIKDSVENMFYNHMRVSDELDCSAGTSCSFTTRDGMKFTFTNFKNNAVGKSNSEKVTACANSTTISSSDGVVMKVTVDVNGPERGKNIYSSRDTVSGKYDGKHWEDLYDFYIFKDTVEVLQTEEINKT